MPVHKKLLVVGALVVAGAVVAIAVEAIGGGSPATPRGNTEPRSDRARAGAIERDLSPSPRAPGQPGAEQKPWEAKPDHEKRLPGHTPAWVVRPPAPDPNEAPPPKPIPPPDPSVNSPPMDNPGGVNGDRPARR